MALSVKKKMLAELMALQPDWTNADYAREIGIDQKTLYRWKKEENFKEYLHSVCMEKFKDLERLAIRKLEEQIIAGDFRAVQYVLDGTGYKAADMLNVNADNITLSVSIEE
jgi:hypothetical protein